MQHPYLDIIDKEIYVGQNREKAEYWHYKAIQTGEPEAVADAKKELVSR